MPAAPVEPAPAVPVGLVAVDPVAVLPAVLPVAGDEYAPDDPDSCALVRTKLESVELAEAVVPLVPVAPAVAVDDPRWMHPVTVTCFDADCEDEPVWELVAGLVVCAATPIVAVQAAAINPAQNCFFMLSSSNVRSVRRLRLQLCRQWIRQGLAKEADRMSPRNCSDAVDRRNDDRPIPGQEPPRLAKKLIGIAGLRQNAVRAGFGRAIWIATISIAGDRENRNTPGHL